MFTLTKQIPNFVSFSTTRAPDHRQAESRGPRNLTAGSGLGGLPREAFPALLTLNVRTRTRDLGKEGGEQRINGWARTSV